MSKIKRVKVKIEYYQDLPVSDYSTEWEQNKINHHTSKMVKEATKFVSKLTPYVSGVDVKLNVEDK